MKKVLISGYIGFNNFGDEAIFYTLVNHLKNANYNIETLCNNKKEVSKKYNIKTYNFKNPFEILIALLNCNILISGGGSLLQNKTSNSSLFYYLFIILIAKLLFKKVVIFAQGIEPINGKIPNFITKNILKSLKYITVRDQKSKELLKKQSIDSTLIQDPVYSLVQDFRINPDKKGLIVQLRDFKGLDDKFIAFLASKISKYYQDEVTVFSFQDAIDKKICLNFIDELEKKGIKTNFISNKDVKETIEIINKAEFMISMRLHGLIVSNALKTKTFALSYDEKIKTLVNELNIEGIDIFNYENENLDNKLDAFFNNQINEVHPYRKFHWDYIDSVLESK